MHQRRNRTPSVLNHRGDDPERSIEDLRADRSARQEVFEARRRERVEHLGARLAAKPRPQLELLALSGGGQHGAFGAGFLRGWRERPGASMPQFDVVTGVSTGALLAPYAFLGTEAALKTASALYRDAERIAPRLRLLRSLLLHTGGLYEISRFTAQLDELYGRDLLRALETEFDAGRRLLVVTTDLDLARGRIWDLAREIDSTREGLERLHTILVASSSVPGAFPPVALDGHHHTDGGISSNMLATDLEFVRLLAQRVRESGVRDELELSVSLIVNRFFELPVAQIDDGDIQAVVLRSIQVLLALEQQRALVRQFEIAEAVNAGIEGVSMQVRFAAVPEAWADEPGAHEMIDGEYMRRLQEVGYELALGPAPWRSRPPAAVE